MAFSTIPTAGASFDVPTYAADITKGVAVPHRIGTQLFGNDGKIYVFAKANASIPASTAVCTISASTFLATASGGAYTSPATALVSGDYAWFSKAGV